MKTIKLFFSNAIHAIKGIFSNLKDWKLILVLTIPTIAAIYFASTVAISCDESVTFFNYAKRPLEKCMVRYPEPGNHILNSILIWFSNRLPITDILYKIRLPSVIFSFFTWLVAYSFIKKNWGEKSALFVVAIYPILFMSVYYSYMARGYALLILMFIISLHSIYNIIKYGGQRKDWMFFTVASVLGFYTMPSFLYPFITLNIIILVYDHKLFKPLFRYDCYIAISAILLYSPILFNDGIGALANNQYVTPKSRFWVLENLLPFANETISLMFGFPAIIIAILIILTVFFVIKQHNNTLIKVWFICLLTPFILLFIHSVIPFPRTFSYYGFLFIFLFVVSFREYIGRITYKWLLFFVIAIQIAGFINFKTNIKEAETFNTYNIEVTDHVLQENKSYYVLSFGNHPTFRFEVERRKLDVNVFYDDYYYNDKRASADTINNYDYIIIDTERDDTKIKKPIYSNVWQRVYGKE